MDDDSFSFNHDFTSPMQRIKISTVAGKVENTEQRRETMEKVDEERKHQIDVSSIDRLCRIARPVGKLMFGMPYLPRLALYGL